MYRRAACGKAGADCASCRMTLVDDDGVDVNARGGVSSRPIGDLVCADDHRQTREAPSRS